MVKARGEIGRVNAEGVPTAGRQADWMGQKPYFLEGIEEPARASRVTTRHSLGSSLAQPSKGVGRCFGGEMSLGEFSGRFSANIVESEAMSIEMRNCTTCHERTPHVTVETRNRVASEATSSAFDAKECVRCKTLTLVFSDELGKGNPGERESQSGESR